MQAQAVVFVVRKSGIALAWCCKLLLKQFGLDVSLVSLLVHFMILFSLSVVFQLVQLHERVVWLPRVLNYDPTLTSHRKVAEQLNLRLWSSTLVLQLLQCGLSFVLPSAGLAVFRNGIISRPLLTFALFVGMLWVPNVIFVYFGVICNFVCPVVCFFTFMYILGRVQAASRRQTESGLSETKMQLPVFLSVMPLGIGGAFVGISLWCMSRTYPTGSPYMIAAIAAALVACAVGVGTVAARRGGLWPCAVLFLMMSICLLNASCVLLGPDASRDVGMMQLASNSIFCFGFLSLCVRRLVGLGKVERGRCRSSQEIGALQPNMDYSTECVKIGPTESVKIGRTESDETGCVKTIKVDSSAASAKIVLNALLCFMLAIPVLTNSSTSYLSPSIIGDSPSETGDMQGIVSREGLVPREINHWVLYSTGMATVFAYGGTCLFRSTLPRIDG